jgi:D-alanyl-lipoteichoic acid acyltransferase DltB (MBOAT superfamily)
MTFVYVAFGIAYLLLGRHLVRAFPSGSPVKDMGFAWLNMGFLLVVIYASCNIHHFLLHSSITLVLTAIYVACIGLQFRLLKRGESTASAYRWAFWLPIGALVAFKSIGILSNLGLADASLFRDRISLVGLSYLSFKLSYSALEIENGQIRLPSFYSYLGYALYVPTIFVGPINSLAVQSNRLSVPESLENVRPHLLRIAMGLLKLTFIAGLVERLGYKALVTSAASTAPMDYFIAPCADFLFLYFNFAGACDVAIATSALLGIHVKENFNRPFAARNVQDFWNRWHMTLSLYMRDVVFTPLTMWLTVKLGAKYVNHCMAISVMVVFLLIGLWHGTSANFLLIGLIFGLAVVFNHYYSIVMKTLLGKSYKKVHNHPMVTAVSIALTFYFVSLTALLLNNDISAFATCIKRILGLSG